MKKIKEKHPIEENITAGLSILQDHLDAMLNRVEHNKLALKLVQSLESRLLKLNSLPEIIEFIIFECKELFKLDICTLCLVDSKNNIATYLQSDNYAYQSNESLILINGDQFKKNFGLSIQPILGAYQESRCTEFFPNTILKPTSIAVLPIIRRGVFIGSLNLGSYKLNRFTEEMASDFIEHFATLIGFCLENVIEFEAIRHINHTKNNTIIRSIVFPVGFEQIGLSILGYFNKIIRQKYKDIKVQVSITQTEDIITMVIVTPDGTKDIIEKALNDYGLIVSGELEPELFLENKYHIIELNNQLKFVKAQLELTQQLLQTKDTHFTNEIASLRELVINIQPPNILLNQSFTIEEIIMSNKNITNDQRKIDISGGNYIESNEGSYVQGDYININQSQNSADNEIRALIDKLLKKGITIEEAQDFIAKDLSSQALKNESTKEKLSDWAKNLAQSTASDVVKKIVFMAMRLAGIPMP